MKAIRDKIYEELHKKEIDWNGLEAYIASLGESINLYAEEECVLSDSYTYNGLINKRLTELFLKHGFDVKANTGKNGASCLDALCWSSYDKYILEIAEMLLDAGADSTISCDESEYDKEMDDEDKGVLGSINWKFGYWATGEYDSANIFVAYYEMIKRHQSGKKYAGIRTFRECVGEKVSKIEKMKIHSSYNKTIGTSYVFHCGEKQLIISDYIELIVNPYAREEAIEIEDVSDEFGCLIGANIRGLRYFNSSLAKLNFDNGYALLMGDNYSICEDKPGAWFKITNNKQTKLPEIGTVFSSVKLWGIIRHAEGVRIYDECTVVLFVDECAYALYSNSTAYAKGTVRVEKIDLDLVSGLKRRIDVNNLTLAHVEYAGEAIRWLSFRCDEGVLYMKSDGFSNVSLLMSDTDLDEEDILRTYTFYEGFKKIEFVD